MLIALAAPLTTTRPLGAGHVMADAKCIPLDRPKWIGIHLRFNDAVFAARFWSYVGVKSEDECWLWLRAKMTKGYGTVETPLGQRSSHRVAYALHYGEVPDEMNVLHRCDVTACCNPKHLFLGTRRDNILDCKQKGRTARGQTHGTVTRPERIARGERHGMARLSRADVEVIRCARGTQREIASRYSVSTTTISRIRLGKLWKSV